jgi:DNA-binding NarL/FixJ family response regulator
MGGNVTDTVQQLAAPEQRLRVAGVDDQPVFRQGLAAALAEFDVVGVFACAEDLLAAGPPLDVVVLDLHLVGAGADSAVQQGAAAVHSVAAAGYRVLIYTAESSPAKLIGCLRAGAHGIRHKGEPISALAEAVRTVAAGEYVTTTPIAGLAEFLERRGELPELTDRERAVLRGLARGRTYLQISAELFLSVRTVEQHGASALAKFASVVKARNARELADLLGLSPGDLLDWDPPRRHRTT